MAFVLDDLIQRVYAYLDVNKIPHQNFEVHAHNITVMLKLPLPGIMTPPGATHFNITISKPSSSVYISAGANQIQHSFKTIEQFDTLCKRMLPLIPLSLKDINDRLISIEEKIDRILRNSANSP